MESVAYTRRQIYTKSTTVPDVAVPCAKEAGILFANSNIFGQYAPMKEMLAKRRSHLAAVYGAMKVGMDDVVQKQAALDRDVEVTKKALHAGHRGVLLLAAALHPNDPTMASLVQNADPGAYGSLKDASDSKLIQRLQLAGMMLASWVRPGVC